MRATYALLLAVSVAFATALAQATAAEGRGYRVIVCPQDRTTVVDRQFLEDAFLKKTTRWADGEVIRPVDAGSSSVVRRSFSEEVLGRSVAAVRSYWQQRIFSGRDVPPPELDTDAAVVKYVIEHPGAVGYVADDADVRGVTVLTVK